MCTNCVPWDEEDGQACKPTGSHETQEEPVMTAQSTNPITGSSKQSELNELQDLLEWPGLYRLADAIDEYRDNLRRSSAGVRQKYPTSILLFTAWAARITGSLASAIATLDDDIVWRHLEETWFDLTDAETKGLRFPPKCPDREQVRHFTRSVIANPNYGRPGFESVQHWEKVLQAKLQEIAIAQAKTQGHLRDDHEVDWTRPRPENTVIGDGTVVTRLSDVEQWVDPATKEIITKGSRARYRPRVSGGTDLAHDKKSHRYGYNMVSLHTATEHGWIVLGTGCADGAEQWAALDLVSSVAKGAGAGVHTLLYDRVFTGWLLDRMLGRYGIRVINKSVGVNRGDTSAAPAPEELLTTTSAAEAELRRAADVFIANLESDDRTNVHLVALTEEQRDGLGRTPKAFTKHVRQSELKKLYDAKQALPLGVSLYRATSARQVLGSRAAGHHQRFKLVRSTPRFVEVVSHADGCEHLLYTDDGALHSVESDGQHLVKVATATCLSSIRRKLGIDGGGAIYGAEDTWLLPCPNGDLTYHTAWTPDPRRDADSPESGDPMAAVLTDLRPISRSQANEFADVANARNNAESYNAWFKRRLPKDGRAATLSKDSQEFDFIGAACVRNALTFAAWRND